VLCWPTRSVVAVVTMVVTEEMVETGEAMVETVETVETVEEMEGTGVEMEAAMEEAMEEATEETGEATEVLGMGSTTRSRSYAVHEVTDKVGCTSKLLCISYYTRRFVPVLFPRQSEVDLGTGLPRIQTHSDLFPRHCLTL